MVYTSRAGGNLKKWQRGKVNFLLNVNIIVSTPKAIHDYGGIIT